MKLGKLLIILLLLCPMVPTLAWPQHGSQVAILRSKYTMKWFINGPAYHAGEPWGEEEFGMYWGGWHGFLQEMGIGHKIIGDEYLEHMDLTGIKVLILPNVASMSQREVQNVKAFVRMGGSVIATFGTSWLDERGRIWDGGRFALWDLWGIPVTREFGMFVPSIHIAKKSPVTAGIDVADIPYGANANTLETKESILPRTSITAFLVDASGKVTEHAAIVERVVHKGKVVYFSFSPEYVCSLNWADNDLKQLMANAITYCLE